MMTPPIHNNIIAQKWEELRKETIEKIEVINGLTKWEHNPPAWWIEMMAIQDDLKHKTQQPTE